MATIPDETEQVAEVDAAESAVLADSLSEYMQSWWKRVRGGESGTLPVLIGLVIIVVVFQVTNSNFLTASNMWNLVSQGAAYVLLGMAEIFVLLLGEIDLSIGFISALGAFVSIWLTTDHGWPWGPAVVLGLALATVIGLVQGLIIVRLGLPSFVVTLAGLLGWQGVLILVTDKAGGSTGGTISADNPVIHGLVSSNIPVSLGWLLLGLVLLAYVASTLLVDRGRRRAGLATVPFGLTIAKCALVVVLGIVLVAVLSVNRGRYFNVIEGVPWVVPYVLAAVVAWSTLLSRTRFGRYVYAVGGNAEAARRAGIAIGRVRVACFGLAGLTAGLAGLAYASNLGSISDNVNGGQLVLYAVAAAVIGGASLFGGHGRMVHALLGGLVIATIANGMGLISLSAPMQYIVTALVLLAAVTVDALARRGQSPT
ncbi:MAG: sugar ABC transporter permease [Nocardioidaceae bacterium]